MTVFTAPPPLSYAPVGLCWAEPQQTNLATRTVDFVNTWLMKMGDMEELNDEEKV